MAGSRKNGQTSFFFSIKCHTNHPSSNRPLAYCSKTEYIKMRFHLAAIYFLSPLSGGTAFVPSSQRSGLSRQQGVVPLYSTIAEKKAVADVTGPAPSLDSFSGEESTASTSDGAPVWTGAEIKSRLERQLEKLRIKDGTSTQLTEEVSKERKKI